MKEKYVAPTAEIVSFSINEELLGDVDASAVVGPGHDE